MSRTPRSIPFRIVTAVLAALPACGIEQAGTGGGGGGGGNGGGGGGTVVGGGGTGSTGVPFETKIDFTATVTQVLSGDTIVLSDGTRIQYGDTSAPPAGTRCALDALARNAELVLDRVVGVSSCAPTPTPTTTAFADDAAPVRAHVVRMDVANLVPGTLTLEGWLAPDAITTCTQAAHDFYTNLAASAAASGAGVNGPNCLEDPVGYGSASIDALASVFDPPGDDINDLNGEYVTIRADGGHVDLTGWKLKDEIGYVYTFPAFVLYSGKSVRVHTGPGTNTVTDLYWNLGLQAWNQTGDRVSLIDAEGRLIDSYSIG